MAAPERAEIRRRVFVAGRVQGVGFRVATGKAARAYPGLRGFVRNLPDGRVEALFQGAEDAVLTMVAWCRRGPFLAKVTALEVREEVPAEEVSEFSVER